MKITPCILVLMSLLFTFPALSQLSDIANSDVEGPVVVMDLVKFKPGGHESYKKYDAIAEAKLKSLGGEVVFRGTATNAPPAPSGEWDLVTLRKYPTPAAVLAMGASKEYQGAFPHRLAGVEKSYVYAFSGERPSWEGGPKPTNGPLNVVSPAPNADTFYMLNLLRFKGESGKKDYFTKYGPAVSPMIGKLGGGPVLVMKGIAPVISEETVDRFILVRYPTAKSFTDMFTGDEYRKVAHLRTDAIEMGVIFPFKSDRVAE